MAQAQENPLNKNIIEPLADFSKKGLQFLEKVRVGSAFLRLVSARILRYHLHTL